MHQGHPLPPATGFAGRAALVDALARWLAEEDGTRVVSLVAQGGTGKTALARHLLDQGVAEGPVFVWSFYDDPSMDAFLGAAYLALGARHPAGPTRGRLELVRESIRAAERPLIVLDGLESVQLADESGTRHGRFESHELTLLLRSAASGYLGRARFLLTSRFPILDLDDWEGRGARSHQLEDLDPDDAVALLAARGIDADEPGLREAVTLCGGHALTLAVLAAARVLSDGLDISILRDGDASERLSRLLGVLGAALSHRERAALALLSLFPQGADSALVAAVVAEEPELAAGPDAPTYEALLDGLEAHGLVFSYARDGRRTFTAHPFIRDHFAGDLPTDAARLHGRVAHALEADLRDRPGRVSAEQLPQVARVLHHTLQAGFRHEALALYRDRLGGYAHLALDCGLYDLGARSVAQFSRDGTPAGMDSITLLNDWALFAQDVGDTGLARTCRAHLWAAAHLGAGLEILDLVGFHELSESEQAGAVVGMRRAAIPGEGGPSLGDFATCVEQLCDVAPVDAPTVGDEVVAVVREIVHRRMLSWRSLPNTAIARIALNQGHLQLLTGQLQQAMRSARIALRLGGEVGALSLMARALHLLGLPELPTQERASLPTLWRARTCVDRGTWGLAELVIGRGIEVGERDDWREVVGFLRLERARVRLATGDLDDVDADLLAARDAFASSGHGEGIVASHFMWGLRHVRAGAEDDAARELDEAIQLAVACGFQLWATRAGAARAELALWCEDLEGAWQWAHAAVAAASEDAWGRAEALHPLDIALLHLGAGPATLVQAAELRGLLGHPGVEASRAALEALT